MSSRAKTIIGILLFIMLLGGAYFAYNKLSIQQDPLDGMGLEFLNSQKNGDISSDIQQDNNLTDAPIQNEEENHNLDKKTSDPDSENNNGQEPNEGGDDSPQKLKAFDFTVYDVDGTEVKLSDFYGKPIIINFWATWCPYCLEEMPLFEEKYQKYKEDIHFLMVDAVDGRRETKEKGQKYIEDSGYTFPVFYDLDLDAISVYEARSMPTTVFIDKDGYIIAYQPGMLSEDLFETGVSLIFE
jgi:thiol-disulfide isomerase/thioredoxin